MPRIWNVPAYSIRDGSHPIPKDGSYLIQISDPCGYFPRTPHEPRFSVISEFEFLDIEADNEAASEFGIQQDQADQIVSLLKQALEADVDVLVHCTMGVCRSGAVVDVAVAMGFDDPESFRAPNLLVKHSLMRSLGWTYDSDKIPYVRPNNET